MKIYAEKTENAFYIDYLSILYDTHGTLRRDIYLDDMLHFNERGYEELSSAVYDFFIKTL